MLTSLSYHASIRNARRKAAIRLRSRGRVQNQSPAPTKVLCIRPFGWRISGRTGHVHLDANHDSRRGICGIATPSFLRILEPRIRYRVHHHRKTAMRRLSFEFHAQLFHDVCGRHILSHRD
jgi:hypothetical protein